MALTRVKKITNDSLSGSITANKLDIGQIGGRKNMIINGAMQVAQRASTVTGIGASSGYFSADRWRINVNGTSAGRLTMKHAAPNDLPGFQRSIKLECTTADTSIAAGERMFLETRLEGQDVQGMMKGTSDAKAVTVSFYVKGHDSATYTVGLYEATSGRKIAATFPVTTSWVRQTVTFPGDTTGVMANDNTVQLHLRFYLHSGSNYTSGTLGTSWNADGNTTQISSSGNSFFESTSAEFFLTGVQMEIGEHASPFEHRSYGEELSLCQRYYQVVPKYTFFNGAVEVSSNSLRAGVPITRPLRASPTIGNITLIVYDDDDTSFSNAAHAVFANSGSYEVDGSTGFLSVVFNGNLSGRTDNHNVTALYGTDGTLDAEL